MSSILTLTGQKYILKMIIDQCAYFFSVIVVVRVCQFGIFMIITRDHIFRVCDLESFYNFEQGE